MGMDGMNEDFLGAAKMVQRIIPCRAAVSQALALACGKILQGLAAGMDSLKSP